MHYAVINIDNNKVVSSHNHEYYYTVSLVCQVKKSQIIASSLLIRSWCAAQSAVWVVDLRCSVRDLTCTESASRSSCMRCKLSCSLGICCSVSCILDNSRIRDWVCCSIGVYTNIIYSVKCLQTQLAIANLSGVNDICNMFC